MSASGIVDFDNVGIGDVTLSLQSVQRAKISREDNFIEDSADDIPGLAFRNLNSVLPNSVKTPLELMIEQGNLKDRLFTVNLGHECFFTFGFNNEATRGDRDIHWVEVNSLLYSGCLLLNMHRLGSASKLINVQKDLE